MHRRSFLAGILGAAIAPAFVRPTSLMPLWLPATEIEVPSFDADWVTWSESAEDVAMTNTLLKYFRDGKTIDLLRPRETIFARL